MTIVYKNQTLVKLKNTEKYSKIILNKFDANVMTLKYSIAHLKACAKYVATLGALEKNCRG